ncbi:RNA-binding RNA processing protein rpp1 [Coemansia sp. RSA 1933]|nr:RNA-binding RNA processing protein rpp1 [Coemansia sp. RSA 1933]
MEVLDRQEALLTNYEVYKVLKEEEELQKATKSSNKIKHPENVTTLKFEALQYLSNSPCTTQSSEQIASAKAQLLEYDLTKAEILQIINLRPKTPVELHLIIEECGERFTMEGLDELLEIILSALPREESDEADEAAESGEEGEPKENLGEMFYDLNIALPDAAGKAGGQINNQDWTRVAQTIERARTFGYNVVALNQTVYGKLTPEHQNIWKCVPDIGGAIYSWDRGTGARIDGSATGRVARDEIRVLRRLTVVVSDASHGLSISSSGGGLASEYDIVAVQPTSEKFLLAAINGSWDTVDLISLDMGSRWGFFVKHKAAGQALASGYAFEISYKPALTDSSTRQQWVSNASGIVRITRGKGLVWTSGASKPFDMRSPYDITALGEALQLNGDLSKRALSSNPRAVLMHAFTRSNTLKAVMSVRQAPEADDEGTGPESKKLRT